MSTERIFQFALLISIIIHGAVLFHNFNLFAFKPGKKAQENIEINYLKPKPEAKQETKQYVKIASPEKRSSNAKKINPPPFVDIEKYGTLQKNKTTTPSPVTFTKPSIMKSDIIAMKKKITLPPVDLDKIKNPSYINYYQIVREKIKRAAYQNYMHTETGEVFVSFLISADGYLGQAKIIEDKSSPSGYLREIALKSVKDASPFPNFPAELNYPELSFNVVISFEIE